jgi:S1-C subfamily serine protease
VQIPQVVRIFAHAQTPDYDSPWQAQPPTSCTGSGVIIGPGLVLTGAHVIADATFLQVQHPEDPDKGVARVRAVSHDCDLALLEVEDSSFTRGIEPAELGELPELRDRVSVAGFPVGGDELSITEGVVSRVEVLRYSHSQRYLLAATVDAAINEGSSGGPVFKDGKIAGIAFQRLSGADGIGDMVPAPLIRQFLKRANTEREVRLPDLGVKTQNLENPRLRADLGLGRGQSGVLVTQVDYGSSAWGVLRPRDTLLSLGGLRLSNNGTVRYQDRFRTLFSVVLGERAVGEPLELTLLREGNKQRGQVVLKPQARLVPHSQYDVTPSYFIWGGLVLQPLSRDFLETWDDWREDAPQELVSLYRHGVQTQDRQQAVVITRVLADDLTVGYGFLDYELVHTLGGRRPRHLRDVVRWLDEAEGRVELVTSLGSLLVYDAAQVRAAASRILERYRIPRDRSGDLDAA